MKRNSPTWLVLALALGVVFTSSVYSADWLVLNPLQIEFILRYDSRINKVDNAGNTYRSVSDTSIAFIQGGSIVDPRLVNFSIGLEPTYTYGRLKDSNGKSSLGDSNLNYDIWLHLLSDSTIPASARLNAMRYATTSNGALGSYSRTFLESNRIQVDWKNSFFPATLRYEARAFKQLYTSGLDEQTANRDEVTHSLRLDARSSHTWLMLEAFDMDDRIESQNNDFERLEGYFTHRFEWGHRSNLSSRVNYLDRTGFNAVEQLRVYELARINHSESFVSNTLFSYNSSRRLQKTDILLGKFDLTHSLYENLDSTVFVQRESISNDDADQVDTRSGLDFHYQKNDLFGVSFSGGIGGFYGYTDLDSRAGLIEVVDEPHIVPLAGDVLLNRRYVLTATIIVTDTSGTLVYVEGVDYEVRAQAEGFTQIFAIPGGRIQTGDRILVSYLAEALPSSKYSTVGLTADFSISWRGFRLSYYSHKTDFTLKEGAPGQFLSDAQDSLARLEYRHDFTRSTGTLGFERRKVIAGAFGSMTYTYSQSLDYQFSPRTLLNLKLTESFSKYDTADSDIYEFRLSLTWRPAFGLSVQPTLGAWQRKTADSTGLEDYLQEEQFLTAGLVTTWSYRKIWVDLDLFHNRRDINGSKSTDNSIMLNLRRRFR